jgi:hypothetical protein
MSEKAISYLRPPSSRSGAPTGSWAGKVRRQTSTSRLPTTRNQVNAKLFTLQ